MAEWLFEAGIGEDRAILVEGDTISEAAIELPGVLRPASVVEGRLAAVAIPGRRGIVEADGGEILVEPLPRGVSEGRAVRVEILRAAISEAGRAKRAKGRIVEAGLCEGPSLGERVGAVPLPPSGPDRFEQAGWSELLEEANGEIAFPGGSLRMSLTPAMTLLDVDGALPPAELAIAGAAAAGRAIRRFGICGSIGIDLPTVGARGARQAAAAALDAVLPPPFERTAVNGFGFLQIVRPRHHASIPELIQGDPVGAAARALLRRAERAAGAGERTLVAAPGVIARIEGNPEWLETLGRRIGARVGLRADPARAISAGHVQSRFAP